MAKNSSKVNIVSGLAFFPANPPPNFWTSLRSWYEAGKPNNAYVYDSVDTLLAAKIKIVDAKEVRGVWHKLPRPLKPGSGVVKVDKSFLVPMSPGRALKTLDKIQTSDTKAHHKLAY